MTAAVLSKSPRQWLCILLVACLQVKPSEQAAAAFGSNSYLNQLESSASRSSSQSSSFAPAPPAASGASKSQHHHHDGSKRDDERLPLARHSFAEVPATKDEAAATAAAASTMDYLSALSSSSKQELSTTTMKVSYAPYGTSSKANSQSKDAKVTAPKATATAAASSSDYLSSMSSAGPSAERATGSSSKSKNSYAPGSGASSSWKQSAGSSESARTGNEQQATSHDVNSAPAASTSDYLSRMASSTSSTSSNQKSYSPGSWKSSSSSRSLSLDSKNAATVDESSNGAASTSDYLTRMSKGSTSSSSSSQTMSDTSKQSSYAPGGATKWKSQSAASSSEQASDNAAASTTDYLSRMSKGQTASGSKQKSYAPASKFKQAKETGFLAGLSASHTITEATAAPQSSSAPAAPPSYYKSPDRDESNEFTQQSTAAASTSDYLSAMSGVSASKAPKQQSYAPGGKWKPVKETGFLAYLSSNESNDRAPASPTARGPSVPASLPQSDSPYQTSSAANSAASASTGDYLSSMSGATDSSKLSKQSFAPGGGGKWKPVKESGFLAGLSSTASSTPKPVYSAAPEPSPPSQPIGSANSAPASTIDYLSSMSGATGSSKAPKQSFAPGGSGKWNPVKESGFLAGLSSTASSTPKPIYSAAPEPSPPSQPIGSANSAPASTGDYLSSMSGATVSSKVPKQSFAPGGGGKWKPVKESGFLAGLSSAASSVPKPENSAAPELKSSPDLPQRSGLLSTAVPASTGDYLSSMSSSGATGDASKVSKQSFAPGGGGKWKPVKESGFLAGLSSVASAQNPENSAAPELKSSLDPPQRSGLISKAVPASTGDYLSSMSSSGATGDAFKGSKQSFAPGGGGKWKPVKESGVLAGLSSAASTAAPSYPAVSDPNFRSRSQPQSSDYQPKGLADAAPSSAGDFQSSVPGTSSVAANVPKQNYAPGGGGTWKPIKESGSYASSLPRSIGLTSESANKEHDTKSTSSSPTFTTKQSFAPGGGKRFMPVKATGFLAGLSSTPPAHDLVNERDSAVLSHDGVSNFSSTDAQGAAAVQSSSPGSKIRQSFAPGGGGKWKPVKETGFLAGLSEASSNQMPSDSPAPTASQPSTESNHGSFRSSQNARVSAASSSSDYLSAMASNKSGTPTKQSYAPGGGKFKPVKETGFLASLSSAAAPPTIHESNVPSPNHNGSKATVSTKAASYLSTVSRQNIADSTTRQQSYAPGGGDHNIQRAKEFAVSDSSISRSYATASSTKVPIYRPSSPDSSSSSRAVSTSDYLSAMTKERSASTPKQSFAPGGGGKYKPVRDTGFLAGLSSPTSVPAPEYLSVPTEANSAINSQSASSATTSDYLSSMSAASLPPKQSFAPGGAKFKRVEETGFLAGLSSSASVPLSDVSRGGHVSSSVSKNSASHGDSYTSALLRSPQVDIASSSSSESDTYDKQKRITETTTSSGDYLSSLSTGSSVARRINSHAPFGMKYAQTKDTGYLASLAAAPSGTSNNSGSSEIYAPGDSQYKQNKEAVFPDGLSSSAMSPPKFQANAEREDAEAPQMRLSSPSNAAKSSPGSRKSYAPGGASYRAVKDDAYLGSLWAPSAPSSAGHHGSVTEAATFSRPYRASAMPEVFEHEELMRPFVANDDNHMITEPADDEEMLFLHNNQQSASVGDFNGPVSSSGPPYFDTIGPPLASYSAFEANSFEPPYPTSNYPAPTSYSDSGEAAMFEPQHSEHFGPPLESYGNIDSSPTYEPPFLNDYYDTPIYEAFDSSATSDAPQLDVNDFSRLDDDFTETENNDPEHDRSDELSGFCPYVVDEDLQGATLVDYSLHTEIENTHAMDDKLIVLQRLGGHTLNVESFEIELQPNAAGDFGWTMYDTDFFLGNIVVDKGYIAGSLFVGPEQPVEVTVYSTENTERIKTTTLIRRSDKTIIRCANRGAEWYVNGQLVATTPDFAKGICSGGTPAPYVGIQTGSFRFTKLDFVK
ncbi:hypothetical protein MPSEU_001057200 [Mayamaea pseudoterrestris]|nr:hypothetical protein MPSEU_001057200 [Mayamaea pseudoterrestris]